MVEEEVVDEELGVAVARAVALTRGRGGGQATGPPPISGLQVNSKVR
jgi:hypothetical protein